MIPATGKGSDGKIIQYKLPEYEGEYQLKVLSQRMVIALLTSIQPLDWMKRHIDLPLNISNQAELSEWTDDLRRRLMEDFDFCAKVAECIQDENGVVRQALREWIESEYPMQPIEGIGEEEKNEQLLPETEYPCDLNLLFARCREVIRYTHLAVKDIMDKFVEFTDSADLIKAIWDTVPGIALLDDAAGVNGVVQIVEYYRNAYIAGYEAQWTETPLGTFDQLSYALFCECKIDCVITVRRILDMYRRRLDYYFSPPSLQGLISFLEVIAGINQNSTFVLYFAHYVAWGMVELANLLFGATQYSNSTLKLILAFVDEGDNDWQDIQEELGECVLCFDTKTSLIHDMLTVIDGELVETEEELNYVFNTTGGYATFEIDFHEPVLGQNAWVEWRTIVSTPCLDEVYVELYNEEEFLGYAYTYSNNNDGAFPWFRDEFNESIANVTFTRIVFKGHHVCSTDFAIRGKVCVQYPPIETP